MSLRIVPAQNYKSQASNTASDSAPSAPGLHDTLRSKLPIRPAVDIAQSEPNHLICQSAHPLEIRLKHWQATQSRLNMNILRRTHGIGEPVRRAMETRLCQEGEWRPSTLGGSAKIGSDVILGRDTELTWEDVYHTSEIRDGADFHAEMESSMGMNW